MSVPDPAATDWVPLWSLGTVASALPADTAIPAATRIIANKLLVGDAQPSWRLYGDGKQEWGPGGSTVPDTNLYRRFTGQLATDGTFVVGKDLFVDFSGGSKLYFGNSADVNLYRSAAGVLKTDQVLCSATSVIANQGLANQLQMNSDGRIYLGSAADTNLYRSAADNLKTDDTFRVGLSLVVDNTDSQSSLYFGSALDARIWRGAAGNIFLSQTLRVDNAIVVGQAGGNGIIYFNNSLDTNLYRQTAGQLKANSLFLAGSDIYSCHTAAQQVVMYSGRGVAEVIFGQPNDCSLYRESAHWINHYSADGAWGGFKAAVFSVQSDRAKKSEIEPADVPVERLLETSVYTYRRDKHPGRHLGLIADELPDELLDEGMTPEGETLQFVDLYKLASALLATVQHLDSRLKVLEGGI
jgi:Chaperone of endosialidase